MSDAAKPSLLYRMTHSHRPSRPQEPADMGTAFGMEQSLDEMETDAALGLQPTAATSALDWLQRLLPGRRAE